MSDLFNHYITKYVERLTNLESHLLCLQDNYGIFQDVEDINIHLYPHKVISITNNVVFRALYEDIKDKNKDNNYILLFNGQEDSNKLLDFISRAEGKMVYFTSIQDLMQCFEETLKWNERINEFDISDIKCEFNKIVYYGKDLRKSYINKEDIDKIVLSSLLDLDATRIKDEGDCYLYLRDINEIYGGIENFKDKYRTNINELMIKVFNEHSLFISDVIRGNILEQFDELVWVSCVLNDYNKLSKINLKIVLGEENFKTIKKYESHLDSLLELANLINKKDKRYFIKKKDWAEKIISKAEIDVFSNEHSYKDFFREKKASFISVITAIRELLENYNLEGHKKVYSTRIVDLHELQKMIEENNQYRTDNITEIINLYKKIVKLVEEVEYIESEIKALNTINNHKKWQEFYKDHLCDLQYKLSEIRFLDKDYIIEEQRYIKLDYRLSNILNKYRDHFAKFLEENYSNWKTQEYGISRPILNSDIASLINIGDKKTYILIFDGMRYDAWNHIVSPYFEQIFQNKDISSNTSFALLPSITSTSREAIYSEIIKDYKKDTVFLTKSESVKNQNEIKEMLLEDKKNNIFVFNMFDKDGHKATEDFYIFYDKQRKVFENTITELLKLIPEDANIIVASDHGLMRMDDYCNIKDIGGILNVKSRYLVAQKIVILENAIEIADAYGQGHEEKYLLSYNNSGYFIGGGERDFYSHGGASIEEVILPFIIANFKPAKEKLESYEDNDKKVKKQLVLDDFTLNISFNLTEKEEHIIKTLYSLKNQTITTQDIEKKLIRVLGSAGMINSLINRLIKKLKKDGLDIIDVGSAGDIILYKFKHSELKGAK